LWSGGIWNWLDPLTLIRAVGQLAAGRPELKLFFMARAHFDAQVVAEKEMGQQAVALARELGLLDRQVFFGEWVPYDLRENYLLEADLGASLHRESLETQLAVRTRLLDALWAGLPMIVTRGDELADQLARAGVARAVAPGDVTGVAGALASWLDSPDLKTRLEPAFERARAPFVWERAAAPLLAYCRAAAPAADAALRATVDRGEALVLVPPAWWRLPLRALDYARAGGWPYLWQGVRLYARWLSARFAARDPGRPGAGGSRGLGS
jgi:glycosyltransferase involved in cell wall biosynthesis